MRAVFKTFDDWYNCGYIILKGSKSIKRNSEGVCLFSDKQVTPKVFNDHGFGEENDYEDDPFQDPYLFN